MKGSYDWTQPCKITLCVDGFEYLADYNLGCYGSFKFAHVQFFHKISGKISKSPTPLTDTGFSSEHLTFATMMKFSNLRTALSEFLAIRHAQNMQKFRKSERLRLEAVNAKKQMSLF